MRIPSTLHGFSDEFLILLEESILCSMSHTLRMIGLGGIFKGSILEQIDPPVKYRINKIKYAILCCYLVRSYKNNGSEFMKLLPNRYDYFII